MHFSNQSRKMLKSLMLIMQCHTTKAVENNNTLVQRKIQKKNKKKNQFIHLFILSSLLIYTIKNYFKNISLQQYKHIIHSIIAMPS